MRTGTPTPTSVARELAFAELMIPIVKGWNTEIAQQTAYLGVQVHGGMGFIEESGAAQYVRDAASPRSTRARPGIQANDLIGRKIARDGGKALGLAIESMRGVQWQLAGAGSPQLTLIGARLSTAVDALEDATRWIVAQWNENPRSVLAGAGPFLELAGVVCGGAQLGRAALAAARKLAAGDGDARVPARQYRDLRGISPTMA